MLTEACSIRDLALVVFAVFLSVAQSNLGTCVNTHLNAPFQQTDQSFWFTLGPVKSLSHDCM